MEGFTVALALVDAIPVLSFGISMVIIAGRFQSPLFMVGAGLSVLAGCCKADPSKVLIPCYKNMDVFELPGELACLQAMNMGRIGFIYDLLRGIQKITGRNPR